LGETPTHMRRNKWIIVTGLLIAMLAAYVGFAMESEEIEAPLAEQEAEWMTDFEAAKAQAKESGKPMLLDFTGSDWCIWCVRLKEEVFSRQPFVAFARDELVLVKLDFPRSKPQSEAVKAQNEALLEEYGVRGFPTIVLLSPEGELVDKTGYRSGGPEAYVTHLKDLLAIN